MVVVSNQAGVARGLYGEADVRAVHERIASRLREEAGAAIDGFYFCPHHPDFTGACRCRKPEPGMLLDAARDLDLELGRSWVVGDRESDLEAGKRLGVRGILVLTGYGKQELGLRGSRGPGVAETTVDDFAGAVDWILAKGERVISNVPP